MFNVVIFGKPGSGKGTQANFLKEKYSLYHISTGDLFRKNISNKTKLGIEAKSYLDNGDLVPDDIIFSLISDKLNDEDIKNGFILDGFPRNLKQAQKLDQIINEELTKIIQERLNSSKIIISTENKKN